MNETSQPLKSLILDVAHLCERTRELAESGRRDAAALGPVREALDCVRRAADSLGACWELESLSPALPQEPEQPTAELQEEASEDWLFGESAAG